MLPRRIVIVNADDFGYSSAVNDGIVQAHLAGVVTSASLMMGGDAVSEAVALARHHSGLAVGLHVSFADVEPCLQPEMVPMLVQSNGRFPPDERALYRALRSTAGRRQVRAEMAAQFCAFHSTELAFDHVNTHRNVHLHPVMAPMIFREASRWRVTATRIPWEPPSDVLRFTRMIVLRILARMFGLRSPWRSIGRVWNASSLADVLRDLPQGVTEIYCHPMQQGFPTDFASLLDPRMRAALNDLTISNHRLAHSLSLIAVRATNISPSRSAS